MEKVNKNYKNIPPGISIGRFYYDDAIAELERIQKWPNQPSTVYKAVSVKKALYELYGAKCSFCNQRSTGSSIHIEHFRPKNGVKNATGHSGYYWLGYEWSNLLYACSNCNTRKGTNFKLINETTRVNHPTWNGAQIDQLQSKIYSETLRREKFTLLNPELDYPEKHLVYLADGKLHHKTLRGKYTIDVLGLNRDELYVLGRKKLLDEIIKKLNRRVSRYVSGERDLSTTAKDLIDIIDEEILEPIETRSNFDHFLKTIFSEYDKYIVERFSEKKAKSILLWVFGRLKQGINLR